MSKFNTKTQPTITENKAGGQAYKETPKLELISVLLTSFVKDQYYRSGEETMQELSDLITGLKDKKFAAKAAIYARTKYGMRSITHVVAGELAKQVKGEPWTKGFLDKVVFRPDDMTEILSYYTSRYGKRPIPNSLKKGFASAITRFDEYQIAKYKKDGAEYSLVDVVNLVRPKANGAIKKLMTGTLTSPETWEVKMTKAGKAQDVDEAKREVWQSLLKTKKIGYFALLRNLRNILEQADDMVDMACELLTNEDSIKKSLVLPFRFATAMRQIEQVSGVDKKSVNKVLIAINKALETSMQNVPEFDGKTLVVVDHSGSMESVEHGDMTNFELGALFGVAMAKKNDADFLYFGDTAKYAQINPLDSTSTIVQRLKSLNDGGYGSTSATNVGHGTNFHSIFQEANQKYDRIIIFSDMQGWMGYDTPVKSLNIYKTRLGANPKIYSVDLTGNGTLQFPEKDIYCLAGFSEKMFDVMKLLESDKNALINEIEQVSL